MADEKDKGSDLKKMFKDFGTDIAKDAKSKAKAWAWGAINDGLDMVTNNAKKSISSFIFKGDVAPRINSNGRMWSSDSPRTRDYANISSSGNPYRKEDLGNRSALDVSLIHERTEEDIDYVIKQVFDKIDAMGRCRVGDLYGFPTEKIAPSVTDWQFGWSDKDKGGFDKKIITSGPYAGQWMLIVPEVHRV